jgi:hypothetical protein
VGIIGICAASAVLPPSKPPASGQETHEAYVRCQDRDELARLFTLHNAAKNGVTLEAFTEPLLAGPEDARWDMIFTNIPAKAGVPVLEDFVRRSAGLLNPGGRVFMVAVLTLADFFRETISATAPSKDGGAELMLEQKGPGHTVLVYGNATADSNTDYNTVASVAPVNMGPGFLTRYPFYIRTNAVCEIEKKTISLETIYGAGGFDSPGGAVFAAAKLCAKLLNTVSMKTQSPLLVHEPGQGFFPCWLVQNFFATTMVLSGRNVLALEAAAHNVRRNTPSAVIVPAVDLQLGGPALLEATGGRQYAFIAAFPELLPQSSLPKTVEGRQAADQLATLWDSLPALLADGGIFLAAFSSSEAERFDRKKPSGFTRLGSIKRNGFRALAYEFSRKNISTR